MEQFQVLKGSIFFTLTWIMATVVYCSFIWVLWFRPFSLELSVILSVLAVFSYHDIVRHFVAWRYTLWKNSVR